MNENNNYNFEVIPEHSNIGKIDLNQSALGGLDAINFTNALNDIVNTSITSLILDLSKVEVMNSSGLGMLVNAHSNLKKQNINLCLVEVPSKVLKLLQITHLDKVFKIFDNVDMAVKYIK